MPDFPYTLQYLWEASWWSLRQFTMSAATLWVTPAQHTCLLWRMSKPVVTFVKKLNYSVQLSRILTLSCLTSTIVRHLSDRKRCIAISARYAARHSWTVHLAGVENAQSDPNLCEKHDLFFSNFLEFCHSDEKRAPFRRRYRSEDNDTTSASYIASHTCTTFLPGAENAKSCWKWSLKKHETNSFFFSIFHDFWHSLGCLSQLTGKYSTKNDVTRVRTLSWKLHPHSKLVCCGECQNLSEPLRKRQFVLVQLCRTLTLSSYTPHVSDR